MSGYETAMAQIKERFLKRSGEDLVQFQAFLRDRSVPRSEVAKLAHRLAGSAGIFGFKALSALAKRVDGALLQEAPEIPDDLLSLVRALESLVAETPSPKDVLAEPLSPPGVTAVLNTHPR